MGLFCIGFNLTWIFPGTCSKFKHTRSRSRQSSVLLQTFSTLPAEPKLWLEDQYFTAISKSTNVLIFETLTFEKFYWISLFIYTQNFQCNEAMFEAVEQQDLDAVQILLYQYTLEELDLNTPNSEGLTPLDIAILTNNVPIARTLLHVGAKESPHCK